MSVQRECRLSDERFAHLDTLTYRLKPGEYEERLRIESTRSLSDGVPVITDPNEIAQHRQLATQLKGRPRTL